MATSDAAQLLLALLRRENRPLAASDLLAGCSQHCGKAAVQKSLDALVARSLVVGKAFGKLRLYFVPQTAGPAELKAELQRSAQRRAQAQGLLRTRQAQLRTLEAELRAVSAQRSPASLEAARDGLLHAVREANERLRRCEAVAAQTQVLAPDAGRIERRYERATGAYRKRKRICNDMLEAILEGYPKPKRQLVEDIGVETDEAAGFDAAAPRREEREVG